jgi:hypothetical protein
VCHLARTIEAETVLDIGLVVEGCWCADLNPFDHLPARFATNERAISLGKLKHDEDVLHSAKGHPRAALCIGTVPEISIEPVRCGGVPFLSGFDLRGCTAVGLDVSCGIGAGVAVPCVAAGGFHDPTGKRVVPVEIHRFKAHCVKPVGCDPAFLVV